MLAIGGGAGTLGGQLLSFIAAVTFATILAVVAGFTIAAASNISHDLYTHVLKHGRSDEKREVAVAKWATLCVGIVAIALAVVVRSLNVVFLVGLAFAVAASANLPVILYPLIWRRFEGALCALLAGAISSIGMVIVGPAVIGPKGLILHGASPLVRLTNPGIVSIPIGFVAGWLGSMLSPRSKYSEDRFDDLQIRALTGYGAEQGGHAQ